MRTPLHELERSEVSKAWKQTMRATLDAGNLLRSELGLVNMDIVWSGAFLVPVIAMLATKSARDRDPRGITGWLALAALCHRYSRAADTAIDQDLRACRTSDPIGALLKNLRQHRNSLVARPSDFAGALNDRSGLLATYIACQHRGAKDFFTGRKIMLHDDIDRHHILPRRQFPESRRLTADTIANIAFITSDVNRSISHSGPEVYLKDVGDQILKTQCVPLDESLWRINRAESFFTTRRRLLAESMNDFLRSTLPNRKLDA
jgi:hypothetical protein